MRLSRTVRWLVCVAVLASTGLAVNAHAQRSRLKSFFVTFSNYRILDVRASPSGVAVRVIDQHLLEDFCWTHVMRAYDVRLPDTTVEALASTPLCKLSQRRVDAAIERSRAEFIRVTDGIPYGTFFDSIVAVCGGRERRLVFEYWGKNAYKPHIDPKKLQRVDPAVYAAWTMGERIAALASRHAPAVDVQEEQGTAAAAALVAGRYDAAFRDMCWDGRGSRAHCVPGFWSQWLGDYAGPPKQVGPLPVELRDRDSFKFLLYAAPVFPSIALSARVFGDVRLRLAVDRETGAVTDVTLVDGHPLLDAAAISAAREWRFVASTTPLEPFEVSIHFDAKCPSR
jgi:TonB family protein